ncbi:MAG TPA: hypothetical protein PKD85_19675 [Saprospiraceae bacterium]|nr:hypothetical protein [Saprospiraceae bacterium]
MEDRSEQKYFNFPIVLLQGFLIDDKKCLNNIFDYAIYEYCYKYNTDNVGQAARFFGVTMSNEAKTFENGNELFDSIPEGTPKVGINKYIFFEYCMNDKTEFQKVTLLAFLAIKSILQNKAYCKMEYNYLFARMGGKSHSIKNDNELSPELAKYKNEYQAKKIKNELILSWNLIHYSYFTRGFYVSFKMPMEDLIFQVEKKKKSNQLKEQKEKEKAARIAALNRLNKK